VGSSLSWREGRLHSRQCTLSVLIGHDYRDPRINPLQSSGIDRFFGSQSAFAAESFADDSLATTGTTKVADEIAGSIATRPQETSKLNQLWVCPLFQLRIVTSSHRIEFIL